VKNDAHLKPLTEALEDHGAEGIAILTAEPWRMTQALVIAMVALVFSALVWSFIGHSDVIVTASGTLSPESEVRRFYAPIDGELADLYIAEGQPVQKDDVLARLNARGAIEAATNALEARLKLDDAEREWKQFPEKKLLMERKATALKDQLEVEERLHQNRIPQHVAHATRLVEIVEERFAPRMHGIHHSIVREETDSNWSTIFTWPDRVHGTLRLNIPQQEITIGVPAYQDPAALGLPQLLLLPLRAARSDWQLAGDGRPARVSAATPPTLLAG